MINEYKKWARRIIPFHRGGGRGKHGRGGRERGGEERRGEGGGSSGGGGERDNGVRKEGRKGGAMKRLPIGCKN